MNDGPREIDVKTFWQAIGGRAVGAAVVTAAGPEGRAGFLALSATHLSASPARLMVSVDAKTSALATINASGAFCINYLSEGDQGVVDDFAGKSGKKGDDRFGDADWTSLKTGSPVLRTAVAAYDCQLDEIIERDGTSIAIGRLIDFKVDPAIKPLVSFRGSMWGLAEKA